MHKHLILLYSVLCTLCSTFCACQVQSILPYDDHDNPEVNVK